MSLGKNKRRTTLHGGRLFDADLGLYSGINFHIPFQFWAEGVRGNVQIKIILQAQPELGRRTKIARQAQGGIRRHTALFQDDLVDPARMHTDVEGQATLAQPHRL